MIERRDWWFVPMIGCNAAVSPVKRNLSFFQGLSSLSQFKKEKEKYFVYCMFRRNHYHLPTGRYSVHTEREREWERDPQLCVPPLHGRHDCLLLSTLWRREGEKRREGTESVMEASTDSFTSRVAAAATKFLSLSLVPFCFLLQLLTILWWRRPLSSDCFCAAVLLWFGE